MHCSCALYDSCLVCLNKYTIFIEPVPQLSSLVIWGIINKAAINILVCIFSLIGVIISER